MELKYTDSIVTDFKPTGNQDFTPLHFIYPDSEGRVDPDFYDSFASGIKFSCFLSVIGTDAHELII